MPANLRKSAEVAMCVHCVSVPTPKCELHFSLDPAVRVIRFPSFLSSSSSLSTSFTPPSSYSSYLSPPPSLPLSLPLPLIQTSPLVTILPTLLMLLLFSLAGRRGSKEVLGNPSPSTLESFLFSFRVFFFSQLY